MAMHAEALHAECTRLVGTHRVQGIVHEVQRRLSMAPERLSPERLSPERLSPHPEGCLTLVIRHVLCICFRDEQVAQAPAV